MRGVDNDTNRGKGRALKRGFAYCAERYPGMPIVTADGDGQHTAADIERVGHVTAAEPRSLVMGARTFASGVPARSRLGNRLTRAVFWAAAGRRLADTQTGLRGYSPELLEWAGEVDGDRFEYEMNVLLRAARDRPSHRGGEAHSRGLTVRHQLSPPAAFRVRAR